MNFKRLLNTQLGVFFISLLLGLGFAALFQKVCNDKNCIVFNGPIVQDFEGKTYKYDGKCYQYSVQMEKCNKNKRVIDITSKEEFVDKHGFI
tara:strand:- start:5 stop:280 length:276 start_codon:yes stop_codon:yes gene_type:complete